jgi:FKBP-type peptidyl-prolyl cis-trans isomerase
VILCCLLSTFAWECRGFSSFRQPTRSSRLAMSLIEPMDESHRPSDHNRAALGSDDSQGSLGLARTPPLLPLLERRKLWHATAATIGGALFGSACASAAAATNDEMVPVLKTASGLKYIDLVPGTGPSPAYGNLVSIAYKAYIKLPPNSKNYNTEPQQYDNVNRYLLKHGNGQTIAGLDEGLHTMKVGGKRRILIPPKLGFVDVGLGPLPVGPLNRYRLNQLLDQMTLPRCARICASRAIKDASSNALPKRPWPVPGRDKIECDDLHTLCVAP